MATCKQCGTPIQWGKRKGVSPRDRGAFIALEPRQDPHGIYAIVDDRVVLADSDTPEDAPRHQPHQAFCEAQFRPRRSPLSSEP
jgi:hypothetical protein